MEKLQPVLASLSDKGDAAQLSKILSGIYERMRCVTFSTAGLAIGTTTSKVKVATAFTASVQGVLRAVAITDDAFTPAGVIVTGTTNVYVFSMDKAGNYYSQMGVAGATLPAVKFPNVPTSRTVIGFVVVANASGSDFTGGTTALSAGSITTTYVNTIGAFDVNAALV